MQAAPSREFGQATVTRSDDSLLLSAVPKETTVWASHGDLVASPPPGFTVTAVSANAPVAAMENRERRLHALLFHPEVAHTEHGLEILRAFAFGVCGCVGDWTMTSFVDETVANIKQQVQQGRVLCGLSGGVDSTVAALLIHRAIGDRLTLSLIHI